MEAMVGANCKICLGFGQVLYHRLRLVLRAVAFQARGSSLIPFSAKVPRSGLAINLRFECWAHPRPHAFGVYDNCSFQDVGMDQG